MARDRVEPIKITMRMFGLPIIALLIAGAQPAVAEESASADPHLQLFDLLNSPENEQLVLDATLAQMRTQFLADPNIASFEEDCPGTIDAMLQLTEQVMNDASKVETTEFDAKYIAVLRNNLSIEQATEAVAFFQSDLGQRYMHSLSSSMNFRNVITDAAEGDDEAGAREAYDKDTQEMTRNAMKQLQGRDAFEARLIIGSAEWGKTLGRIRPQLAALEYDLLNPKTSPEEDAELEEAFSEALDNHLSECGLDLREE